MDKKLLIAGIDPGITLGYAIIDIEGNLIHLSSSKQLGLNSVISQVIDFGRVVLVGTDKAKVPALVEAFATKVGARIVNPQEDLKVNEKKLMISDFEVEDEHQRDALASALFAYKSIKALLDKIDNFIDEYKKCTLKNKIKELVITKRISIRGALGLIEKQDNEAKIIEKVIVDKKLSQNDFLKLYDKLKKYEAEIKLVKIHNRNLRNVIQGLNKIKNEKLKDDGKITEFREHRIIFLEQQIKAKEKHIEQLKFSFKKLSYIISNIDKFYILKKLETLGSNEFNFKNSILNIKRNDMLLVNNPNIISNNVIELLKDKVFVVIHKKPIGKKMETKVPFLFIDAKNLKIEEDKYFGFVEKNHLDTEKNKLNWVNKVVEAYKKERSANLEADRFA